MIPSKIRRKKETLGVLRRMAAINARRDGRMLGSVTMTTDIDRKTLWRMRMVDTDIDRTGHPHDGHAPWSFESSSPPEQK